MSVVSTIRDLRKMSLADNDGGAAATPRMALLKARFSVRKGWDKYLDAAGSQENEIV